MVFAKIFEKSRSVLPADLRLHAEGAGLPQVGGQGTGGIADEVNELQVARHRAFQRCCFIKAEAQRDPRLQARIADDLFKVPVFRAVQLILVFIAHKFCIRTQLRKTAETQSEIHFEFFTQIPVILDIQSIFKRIFLPIRYLD